MSKRPGAVAAALAAVLAAALAFGGSAGARSQAVVHVQILSFNDFHGNLEPPAGSSGRVGSTDAGGAAYLATHLKNLAAQNPNTVIVSAGDNIGASPLTSALFHDEPTIEAFNAMNVKLASVGNHEFDEGVAELKRMQKGGCHPTDGCKFDNPYPGAKFPYLSANVVVDPTKAQVAAVKRYNAALAKQKRACAKHRRTAACRATLRKRAKPAPKATTLFPPYSVQTVGGVKVGFIGEVLKGTPSIVTPTAVAGLRFLDEAQTANRYATELKKKGVNAIVLVIHQGDETSSQADVNACSTAGGEADAIVDALSSDISVVLSGHTHQWYICNRNGKLVSQAGSFGRVVTSVDLSVDSTTGKVVGATAKNVPITRTVTPDPTVQAIVDRAKSLAAPLANRVIGSITADVTRTTNAAGESALGDVIADAQLAATSPANKGGAVIAFMNPGGIRADLVASQSSGGEPAGQVTYGEAFTVQPFANVMTVKTMTGDMIKRLLEQQFDNPTTGQTRVLQVSQGFTYSYDLTKPAGQRVDPASIKLNGTVIAPTQQVRVAMNSFLAAGGDNFTVFNEGTSQVGGDVDIDALVAYFVAKSPVAPGPRNRITRTA
ncbi:MAG TPA: bifunctional metallophosphatase/5'-nucleotidase [Gaiellaceae bacterium]|nr:bifunctional metallophosphatase/5'-nucleotidase [Gaiellaceae bacterium]